MTRGNNDKLAEQLAQSSIYDGARCIGQWHGYTVYEPTFADDEPRCIGFPQFILVKSGDARWSTIDETRPLMNAFASDED